MKIVLEGLKMKSDFIDCPDNIGYEYKIEFFEPLQAMDRNCDIAIPGLPLLRTRCIFTFTGKCSTKGFDIFNSNNDKIATEYPRIYRLTDIIKI